MLKNLLIIISILMSFQGNAQWRKLDSGTFSNLNGICFTTPDTGFAVGDSGTIIRTVDAGKSWAKILSGVNSNFTSICFPTKAIGFASGFGK